MNASALAVSFGQTDIVAILNELGDPVLDELEFGVIGIDADKIVRRYNAYESRAAGLTPTRVVGHHLFEVVAPCMNNFLVAQRFEDAQESASALDVTVDYVLTLRMRPVKCRLRLLARPGDALRYVLVERVAK